MIMVANKGERAAQLDAIGIDEICSRIIEGESIARIGKSLGIPLSSVAYWIAANPERSARVREARANSADAFVDKAEDVLLEASDNASTARARELAHHYRWMASKMRPAEFGDKQTVDLNAKVELSNEQVDAKLAELLSKAGK